MIAVCSDFYLAYLGLDLYADSKLFTVGVDDCTVDAYNEALRQMNDRIAERTSRHGCIRFCSLADLFECGTDLLALTREIPCSLPDIPHYLDVNFDREAEHYRRLLMAGFSADPSALRTRIDKKDPTVLALYRGFSRFMLEDLDKNEYTAHLSKSQRRKLSSKVAFEMIKVIDVQTNDFSHTRN